MEQPVTRDVREEQRAWATPSSLEFFQTHRQNPEDLYPSERVFLPDLLPLVASCLDVGCAAGGFSRIMRSFNPALAYSGVDINPEFVALAQAAYPESRFVVGDGIHFDTPPGSYDLVHCSGILHLNSRYRDIVRAMWAQAQRWLLCDFRLTRGPSFVGSFELRFADERGTESLPYIVVNCDELVGFLAGLEPAPAVLRARGYYHPPSPMAAVACDKVLMAFFLIEKAAAGGVPSGPPVLDLDLPEDS